MAGLNGETIAGMAIAGLGIVFILAGFANPAWREIYIADYILVAVGAALIALGIVTMKRYTTVHTESGSGHRRGRY